VHSLAWTGPQGRSHAGRAALQVLQPQAEAGTGCPITMAHSGIPALRHQPEVAAEWEPRLLTTRYDQRLIPAHEKTGAIMGMAMTEKQGGSDVRANTTEARPIGAGRSRRRVRAGRPQVVLLGADVGPVSGARAVRRVAVVLSGAALSQPDGTRNPFLIQRLKDKIGNRSNASSEIEYQGTWARMVGAEGRGVPTIIEMVNHTRLDVALGAAGLMRQSLRYALHHAAHRSAFGRLLIDQPLMKNVLADLALETEAATAMAMRVARAFDEAATDPAAQDFARIATAVAKYWAAKRVVSVAAEALECHGGVRLRRGQPHGALLPRGAARQHLGGHAATCSAWTCCGRCRRARAASRRSSARWGWRDGGDRAAGRAPVSEARATRLCAIPGDFERNARRLVEGMALALEALAVGAARAGLRGGRVLRLAARRRVGSRVWFSLASGRGSGRDRAARRGASRPGSRSA
jgi:putative acyl-CoA dehydrogenase